MKRSILALAALLAVALVVPAGCGGSKSNNAGSSSAGSANAAASSQPESAATAAGIPNCGAVKAVWVNLSTKVYHEPGDQYYGKTKHGEYLCPSQATAQGFHRAGGGEQTGQTRKKGSNSSP
ncbi:MAG TPA: hypothetical protein VMU38_09405 [Candidatus Binatia bacterium]|nr:hypothetical protein [Candidatus Binatia bacterium]